VFVLDPDPYSLPSYRIGPFQTRDLSINHSLPANDRIDTYLGERFSDRHFVYTYNGREAINTALRLCRLSKDDVVTILTTTGNFYISGCVTTEIEKFCKWSREVLPETRVIFVNHEFGYPFPDLVRLKELNLPVIEDCAGSFFSEDSEHTIGRTGDFVVYSFPKMFPLQVGGLLVSKSAEIKGYPGRLDAGMLRYIKNVLSEYITTRDQITARRMANYYRLRTGFESLGLPERFMPAEGTVPGVFMFKTGSLDIDLPELKKHFWAHGVQSSVFYGEKAFFIPVHQALSEADIDYFLEVMRSFIQNRVR
jgi:dTDP-4-amino-4,6-dideoxygalactose transaminase